MAELDPSSEEWQRENESKLEKIGVAVGVSALVVIAKALGRIKEGATITDAMIAAPADLAAFQEIIERGTAIYEGVIEDIFDLLVKGNDEWARAAYEYAGVTQIPAAEHSVIKNVVQAGEETAIKTAESMCNTSVVGLIDRHGQFVPFQQEYIAAVNRASNAIASGEAAYNAEIIKTCRELAQTGLRVQYSSGMTRELYAALSTNIMDTAGATMVETRRIQGVEYGANGKEVSAHTMSAPDHVDYQGKQFTNKEFEEIQTGELRKRPLESGANCRHLVYDILYGVTSPVHSAEELRQFREKSNGKVQFKGLSGKTLEMSGYEATQYQRRLEHRIRTLKTEAVMLDSAEMPAFAKVARGDARSYTRYYKDMSESLKLPLRLDRAKAYMQ